MSDTNALSLESPELSQADYRALREGREVPKTPVVETSTVDAAADTETAVATEETETLEAQPKEPKPGKKKDGLEGRFSELTHEIKSLKAQLAERSAGTSTETKPAAAPEATPATAAADPEPDPKDFTDYIEWQKTWNRWDRRQETRAIETARVAAEQKSAADALAKTWQSRIAEASEAKADFAKVAQNPDLDVTRVMGEAIVESEVGPDILYHLGQNPAEAARIAKLSPVSQIREIGKIERLLESAKDASAESSEEPLTTKPVSKAPAPLRPLSGAAAASSHAKSMDSMTQAEYRALREAGKLR